MTKKSFAADCDTEGYTLNECADCDFSFKSEIVAPTGHDLKSAVTPPSCEKEGFTEYTCECGFSYKSDHIAPTNHTLSAAKTEPTCTKNGFTRYTCECGYTYDSDITAPLGHALSAEKHTPTCTQMGYTKYSCVKCQDSYTADYLLPLGHTFRDTLYYPTFESTGYTKRKCDCGYQYVCDHVMSSDIYKGAYLDSATPLAKGVDVSKWNEEINWSELASLGIDFVIIKAGSTKSGLDPKFEANYSGAKAAGLDVGAYFYTYALTSEEARADAELCATWLQGKQFEYPVYFDLEDPSLEHLSPEFLTEMCGVFIGTMQSKGYFCGLYINRDWLEDNVLTEKVTTYFDVWYARWTLSGEPEWKDSFGSKTGLWQYTDSGRLGSHTLPFDLNVAYKDYPSIMKEFGLNGFEKTKTA